LWSLSDRQQRQWPGVGRDGCTLPKSEAPEIRRERLGGYNAAALPLLELDNHRHVIISGYDGERCQEPQLPPRPRESEKVIAELNEMGM
jgi:hypothetical protein